MKLLVLLLCVAAASGKVFTRCDWARVLKENGMDGFAGVSLADWVCLTQWESHYNTQAINRNVGSTDYGIFQINSKYWCKDDSPSWNGCHINCRELLTDDVAAAIACAKRIVRDPIGPSAWVGWKHHCKNRDLHEYLAGCII
ncbi:lysozyme C-1-like [Nelusetta ayraudi]|uniref:lysozyme C-1-like n=1 Tax=Nelusetta ayraudi TaxID=303726 RepID=UPI003F6EA0B5